MSPAETYDAVTSAPPGVAAAHVEVRGIEQRFGDLHALGPIDLAIAPGEFVSVVGPSGCGKSTLLNAVAGLLEPGDGTVHIGGEPLAGPRDRTSIVFQDSATLPWRTVRDNVAFALQARGVAKAERREVADDRLRAVGLSGFGDHHPDQLSGGMRQRVAIARALTTDPDLVLADEPFAALDEQTRLLMAGQLLDVVERLGCAVLFITHSIQEAVLLSDRVLVMSARPGRIVDEVHIERDGPRSPDQLADHVARAATARIWTLIRDEAQAAMEAVL